MPTADLTVETTLPPETVRGALLDFTERRPDVWPGLTRELYEVLAVRETSAEIREGTKMPFGAVWAVEHYDWSEPGTVRWTVAESNFCTAGSFVSARLEPRAGGGTSVRIHWERTGTTLVGKLVCKLIAATKGKPVASSFEKAMRRLEAEAPAAAP